MTCLLDGERRRVVANYELAARYRRHMPARQTPRRRARGSVARTRKRPVLYQCHRDRTIGLLGANERGTATSRAAELVNPPDRRDARSYLWLQCFRDTCLGPAGAPTGENWSTYACGR